MGERASKRRRAAKRKTAKRLKKKRAKQLAKQHEVAVKKREAVLMKRESAMKKNVERASKRRRGTDNTLERRATAARNKAKLPLPTHLKSQAIKHANKKKAPSESPRTKAWIHRTLSREKRFF